MKKFAVLLVVMLGISMSGYSQFLSNKKNIKIDELNDTIKVLSSKNDSIQKLLDKYSMLYDSFKEKVIKQDFDPNQSASILDSLLSSLDSENAYRVQQNNMLLDSISNLNEMNQQLSERVDSLMLYQQYLEEQTVVVEIVTAKAIENLKKLKELLDDEIITPAEFLQLKRKYVDQL